MKDNTEHQKPFAVRYVTNATHKSLLEAIDFSITKTTERFADRPDMTNEIMDALGKLQAYRKLILTFKQSNPAWFD